MERHRGERSANQDSNSRYSRTPSWSSDNHQRYPNNPRGGGGFSGGHHHHPFNSPPDNPLGSSDGVGFHPLGGRGGYGYGSGQSIPMAGQKRSSSGGFPVRGGSPDNSDGGTFAKLFVGSVPRTATEDDIRPLFEEHGNVVEVALIKDKRTGQQQSCCFIKYATSDEADRAIRALHNQYTLPGGVGPVQVRYADGERERLVEYKLFVGSLNRQATEKDVEEIFSPYGRVEDVYIMRDEQKQSRGCGFVKFSHRDMASAAINSLNGIYVMRGCDQPLTVRFADPKRPRPGESRVGPAFGGPGFGPRSQAPPLGVRPTPSLEDPMGGRMPPNAWHPMSPKSVGPSSQVSSYAFGSHLATRGGGVAMSSPTAGTLGAHGGPTNGSLQGLAAVPSSTSQQTFNSSMAQIQPFGQAISPLQKPRQSPQHLPSSLQLQQQPSGSYSQTPTSQTSVQQLGQLQIPHSVGQSSFGQALPSHQLFGLSGQLAVSQPQIQQSVSAAAQQIPLSLQQQGVSASANQQQFPTSTIQQQLLQPIQQSPTQLPQVLLQQQSQALQSSFQSSQQAFSQLQQQLHLMQPSSQSLNQQQNSQTSKFQSPWAGTMPQTITSTPTIAPAAVAPSTISASPVVPVSTQVTTPLTCNWTEHTSPEGYKYYYNSVTIESKWEKPEELTIFEQQQQQQKLQQQLQQKQSIQHLQPQLQTQSNTQMQSNQQIPQMLQAQPQSQLRQQQQLQLQQSSLSPSVSGMFGQQNIQELNYAQIQAGGSVIDPIRIQQGIQAAQDWMWKNKPTGT